MNSSQYSSQAIEMALVNKELSTALTEGNAQRLTDIYSSDGQLLPPNQASITGKKNIHQYWQDVIDQGVTEASLKTLELDVLADTETAIEVGSYVMKNHDKIIDQGKYMVVWKQQDNQWKYHRDMWNSNLAI